MALKTYQRMEPRLLEEPEDHALFQNVSDHLKALLGDSWHPTTNVETLQGVPDAAKNAWYLWWFAAEVGGNGLSAWVANCAAHAPEIIASHRALKALGAVELLELLEASFAPARSWNAEFLREPEVAWFDQFRGNPRFPTFDEIDPTSYDLAAMPLSRIVAKHIRESRDEL